MPRKRRWNQPKRHGTTAKRHCHQSSTLCTQELTLSFPLQFYLSSRVTCCQQLQSKLTDQPLPTGWVQHVDASMDCLMFASLASNPDIPAVSVNLSLKVDPTLHWSLSCHGVRVELDQCSALSAAPRSIESASALLSILHTITQCEICAGNAQEFQDLIDAHNGTFKSRDGILHIIHQIAQYMYMYT